MKLNIPQRLFVMILMSLAGPFLAQAQQLAGVPQLKTSISLQLGLQIPTNNKQLTSLKMGSKDQKIQTLQNEIDRLRQELEAEKAKSAKSGGGVDGGSFLYTNTSSKHLDAAIWVIKKALLNVPAKILKEDFEEPWATQIDWIEFREIATSVIKDEMQPGIPRSNDQGKKAQIMMDYDKDNKKVIALEPFFKKFDRLKITNGEFFEIVRLVLHETSHLYGIGINKNDKESFRFSDRLAGVILKYWRQRYCGGFGTLAERIDNCFRSYEGEHSAWDKVYQMDNPYLFEPLTRQMKFHPYTEFENTISVIRSSTQTKMITSIFAVASESDWKINFCEHVPQFSSSTTHWRLPTREEALQIVKDETTRYDFLSNSIFFTREPYRNRPDKQCLLVNSSGESVCFDEEVVSDGTSSLFTFHENLSFIMCVADQ